MAHGWLRTQIPREADPVSAGNDQHHGRDACGSCAGGACDDVSVGNPTVGIHSSDLQAMIDASSPGHTLRLSGTCVGNLTFSKDLNLLGVRLDPRSTGTQVDRC